MTAKTYYVRPGLVVALTESKIYEPGEAVKLTDEQFQRHAHQVETEEQYKARTKTTRGKSES